MQCAIQLEVETMDSNISFRQLKKFPALMWIILFGDFITRGSFYMVWPFLAVILYQQFGISATEVGLILTGAAFISVFVGFFAKTKSNLQLSLCRKNSD